MHRRGFGQSERETDERRRLVGGLSVRFALGSWAVLLWLGGLRRRRRHRAE